MIFGFYAIDWHFSRNKQDICLPGQNRFKKCAVCYLEDNKVLISKENLTNLKNK